MADERITTKCEPGRRVVWFSCGAASAVAAKLAVEKYGSGCEVVYCDTLKDEHPDNARFFSDVQAWIGRPITVIKSVTFDSIDDVFERTRYMAGIAGARCTTEMKKAPRIAWQRPDDIHIFGYTSEEQERADSFEKNNPGLATEWLLIDQSISKRDCKRMLTEAGIALPAMYQWFDHNNCIGCVKATSPSYWNRVRVLFPATFARRARQSRLLGARLVRVNNERVFLDELPIDAQGDFMEQIDCGPVCQSVSSA